MKEKRDVAGLAKAVVGRKDWQERAAAAEALINVRHLCSVKYLIEALGDDVDVVSSTAAVALGATIAIGAIQSGDFNYLAICDSYLCSDDYRNAVDAVIRALEHSNPRVRWGAARALGIIKNPDAVPDLKRHLKDADPSVRGECHSALKALGDNSVFYHADPGYTPLLKAIYRDVGVFGFQLFD